MSYDEIRIKSSNFGSALVKLGAKKKDVLATFLPNCSAYPIQVLGAIGIGLTVTPITASFTPSEIARQLEATSPKFIGTVPEYLPRLIQALGKLNDDISSGVRIIVRVLVAI